MIRKRVESPPNEKQLYFQDISNEEEYTFQIKELDKKAHETVVIHTSGESQLQKRISNYLKFGDIPDEHRRALIIILLIVFIDLFAVGLVYPMLPFYARELGATTSDIGAISSTYGILQLFGSFLVGSMSDKYGRKAMFYLSLGSACFSYFSMAIAPSLLILFIVRIPIGLFKQTMSLATMIVADISPPDERARFIGLVGTVVGMGFIVGPTMSGILSNYFGNYYPVYLCTILYLIDIYLLYKYFPDTKIFKSKIVIEVENDADFNFERVNKKKSMNIYSAWSHPKDFFNFLLSSSVTYLLCIQFFATLAELLFSSTFNQFAYKRYELTPSQNGFLLSYLALLDVIVSGLVVGPLTKLRSESYLIKLGLVVYSISAILVGCLTSLPLVLIAIIPTSASFKIFSTCLTSQISKSAPKNELGSIFGISGSLSSLCRAISPYLGAVIVSNFEDSYTGALTGPLLVSSIALSLFSALSFVPISSFG